MESNKVVLMPHQQIALEELKSGSILLGGVGSGKTLTALSFYKKKYPKRSLYVITTAKKRDTKDFEREAALIGVTDIVVDSWNNIKKYKDTHHSFFIFDEQRVVGSGEWAKSFVQIALKNDWILCTATPGDNYIDYIPVLIANKKYRNRTEFIKRHVIYNNYVSFPMIEGYTESWIIDEHIQDILVKMKFNRSATRKDIYVPCKYDKSLYDEVLKNRFNPFTKEPIKNASELVQTLRKITKMTHYDPIQNLLDIIDKKEKVIVFYNYNYELGLLKDTLENENIPYSEWNGSKHEEILYDEGCWAYLVQYTAGAEGWNCIETDTIIFFSDNYSYKTMEQAKGRIDRLNSPYPILYYYHLYTNASIDRSIRSAIENKQSFNERLWYDAVGEKLPSKT